MPNSTYQQLMVRNCQTIYINSSVMLVEDSLVESFNIKVAQNNISLKKPKSLGFIQSDILDTEPNYCS